MTSEQQYSITLPSNFEKSMKKLRTKKTLDSRRVAFQHLPESPVLEVGVGLIAVKLERQVDRASQLRKDLAAEIAENTVGPMLLRAFPTRSDSADLLLHVRLVVVSDGSSMGRMCCGELGVGHAKLVMHWCLADASTVYFGARMFASDSALCGLVDLCGDAGPDCIRDMAIRMTQGIIHDVKKLVASAPFN